jgi:hypothetical protein
MEDIEMSLPEGCTPGPWTAERGNRGADRPMFITASVHDGIQGWTDADAHLIAAAPDLYEALERIVKWMDAQGYNALYQFSEPFIRWFKEGLGSGGDLDDTAIKDAHIALAKARGETA